jgi:hypothetical protein
LARPATWKLGRHPPAAPTVSVDGNGNFHVAEIDIFGSTGNGGAATLTGYCPAI